MNIGRSAIPSYCPRCGAKRESWSSAMKHCPKPATLTLKQTQTLDLLITGAHYQAMADHLGVTRSTIYDRIVHLCERFGMPNTSRVKLALYWAESKSRK